jgi:tRNA A-37 threonylcarbamoyl transferase component Bud32
MTPPERLGKYEVVEALGESANAEVFGAFDPDVNRVVAVKAVSKDLAELDSHAARALARWRNESRLAGRLSHPGIVAVYDYGESGSVAYLAVEFVHGHRLGEYLDRGARFGDADAVSIVAQVLDALQHAHEHGVRHGAVGPGSILVTRSGEAKLAEFGRAATEDGDDPEPEEEAGEPGYVAPEQYARQGVDARADLFAAGAVFFRLLTGRPAYRGTAEQIAYRVSRGSVPLPSQVGAGQGWERYDDVVSRALARDPADRFQTAREFRHALLETYGAPLATVSTEVLIKDPGRLGDLPQPGSLPAHPQWTSSEIAREDAPFQGPPMEDPLEFRADAVHGRWRVVLVVAVVLIALAVVAAIAHWTAPEFGPRAPKPDRAAAPLLHPTAADAPPVLDATSRGAEAAAQADRRTVESTGALPPTRAPAPPLDPTAVDAPAPVLDATSRGADAAAQADRGTVHGTGASPPTRAPARSARPARTPSAPPAPAMAEPASVPEIVPPAPQAHVAPAPQAPHVAAPSPATPATSFWDDQAIAFRVATGLSFDRMLYRSGIQVESAGGIVTLRGHVPSREHVAHAIARARAVEGVREVRSALRVGARDYVFPDSATGLQ